MDVNGGVPDSVPEAGGDGPPVFDSDWRGRPVSVSAILPADMAVPEESAGDPPGWADAEYPGSTDGGFLYRRCLLLPERFGGADADGNVFTGTAYLAQAGLRPVYERIAAYLEGGAGRCVYYRATLYYTGSNFVPDGILIEAVSDDGAWHACAYAWNVQPGVGIDYASGRSWLEAAGDPESGGDEADEDAEGGAGDGSDAQ